MVYRMLKQMTFATCGQGMHDITAEIRAIVADAKVAEGLCTLFIQHTSASLDSDLGRSGSFVTLFHAQLNVETGELRYVDAGHGQVFVLRRDRTITPLDQWGLPVGVSSTERYLEGAVTLDPGDVLVIYSDGLTEALPNLFRDQETLAAQIPDDGTAGAIAQRLVDLATSAGQLPDDLTVVVLRRLPNTTEA